MEAVTTSHLMKPIAGRYLITDVIVPLTMCQHLPVSYGARRGWVVVDITTVADHGDISVFNLENPNNCQIVSSVFRTRAEARKFADALVK